MSLHLTISSKNRYISCFRKHSDWDVSLRIRQGTRGHFSLSLFFSLNRLSRTLLIRLTKPRPNMFHWYTLYMPLLKSTKVHTYLHDTGQCEEPIAEWEALEAAPAWEHKVLIRAP